MGCLLRYNSWPGTKYTVDFFFFTKIRLGVLPFDILPRLLPHTKRRDVRYLSDRSSIVIALIGTIFFYFLWHRYTCCQDIYKWSFGVLINDLYDINSIVETLNSCTRRHCHPFPSNNVPCKPPPPLLFPTPACRSHLTSLSHPPVITAIFIIIGGI